MIFKQDKGKRMDKLFKTIGYSFLIIMAVLFIVKRIHRVYFKNKIEHNELRIFYSSDFMGYLEPCG